MQALLGKITNITSPGETSAGGAPTRADARSLEVKFKAACVLPQRTKIPEWLKDQVLTLQRAVRDPREVGEPGDSLVLTPNESARWLSPLTVSPTILSGELPPTLQVRLRWWKEEKLPEFTVRANGRQRSGQFVKEGDEGVASIETASFFSFVPHLPVVFEVTCDKLKAACTVLPKDEPLASKLLLPEGEQYRLENRWYRLGVVGRTQAGGITSLREKGRGTDHFRSPENLIHPECQYAGHLDRFSAQGWGWSEQMVEAAMTCAGARREDGTVRLALEGMVDEGQNLRTSVSYTLYGELPLLLLERAFQFQKGKGGDKDKEKEEKPKEPIDEMRPVRLGFRAAWQAERGGSSGSRVLCTDGERLTITRPGQVGEMHHNHHWRMSDGWAIAEHPGRREYMMYLFDRQSPPHLVVWMGEHTFTLEPFWTHRPVRPEESAGYATALTAGEICGAGDEGGWVACRCEGPEGGVRCAVVARLRGSSATQSAWFVLGRDRREVPLASVLIPGVGPVFAATADFPEGQLSDPFDAAVGRIDRRRV